MAWSDISNAEVAVNTPAKASVLQKLRDNIAALAAGLSGAPKIQQAAMDTDSVGQAQIIAGSVHQSELSTATASGSVVVAGEDHGSYALTGGMYSWATWSASLNVSIGGGGNLAAGTLGFYNSVPSSRTVYIDERYVTASPPWDLGDGEIALFLYVLMGANGELLGVSVGRDPTWAYHGPTNVTPQRVDRFGKKFRTAKMLVAANGEVLTLAAAKAIDPVLYASYLAGEAQLEEQSIEITTAFKNADMNVAPHPWFTNSAKFFENKTAILLDPFGEPIQRLMDIQTEIGASEVRQIIEGGYLKIDNAPLKRCAPQGVTPCRIRWKNSKA